MKWICIKEMRLIILNHKYFRAASNFECVLSQCEKSGLGENSKSDFFLGLNNLYTMKVLLRPYDLESQIPMRSYLTSKSKLVQIIGNELSYLHVNVSFLIHTLPSDAIDIWRSLESLSSSGRVYWAGDDWYLRIPPT